MKQYYSVLFLDRKTRKLLKKFDYPVDKIRSRFFWEKMKMQELAKLTKSHMLENEDVIVQDVTVETAVK